MTKGWKCKFGYHKVYAYPKPNGLMVYVDGKFAAKHFPEIYAAVALWTKNNGYADMELGEFLKSVLDNEESRG